MKVEEIVIRYRMPSIPADTAPREVKMMEEAQRMFGGQIIGMVMAHLEKNGVELLAARRKDHLDLAEEHLQRIRKGNISVPLSAPE